MSKKEKLVDKLKSKPRAFTFEDAESLLGMLGYKRRNKGKTSGSRVIYVNEKSGAKILLHRPHPEKELREYQVKQLIEHLSQEELI